MNKYSEAICALARRRDVEIAIVVPRVFEAKGCEILIASSHNSRVGDTLGVVVSIKKEPGIKEKTE